VPGYLVLIAAEKPIYDGLRELEEPLSGYLDSMLPVVGDASRGKVSISVQRVEFRERS
jgi:hypothetical protein